MPTAHKPSFAVLVSLGATLRTKCFIAALALGACASLPETTNTREHDRRSDEIDDVYVHNGSFCYFPVDEDDDGACAEFPFALRAAGPGSVALYDRPTTSARVIAEIAPGESVNAVGITVIRYYAHRGIVRRAGGELKVGDTVYPAAWNELDAYPFHDWNEPIYDSHPDSSYMVEGSALLEEVHSDSPDAPLIDWRQLRPRERLDRWYRLSRADGTQGWALVGPCAFDRDNLYECADGERIVQADSAPELNASNPQVAFTLRADVAMAVFFSADSSSIITTSRDGVQRVWNAESGAPMGVAPNVDYPSVTVEDGAANVRTSDGRFLVSVRDDASRVNTARLVADGTRLATLSDNYTASLWDVATGRRLFVFGGRFDRLWLTYSPDGDHIVTWGGSSEAEEPTRIWDAATGRLLHALSTLGGVSAFSPDGRRFAIMGWDIVTIYDTHTGQVVREVRHTKRHESFHSVVFSPDGTRLLTSDPWNTATVWDIATGEVVLRLHPFFPGIPGLRYDGPESVAYASYSPDGRRILTVGSGVVHVWTQPNAVSVDR